MNILHITPSYYPAFKYGGPIQSVHLLNKTLVKKGIKVEVLTTNAGLEENKDIDINKWIFIDGVKVKYLKYYGYEHYTFSPSLCLEALKIVKNYDIVHITAVWNFPVLAGSMVSYICKKPYIISPRGSIYEKTVNIKSKNKKQLYYNLVAKHYLKRANAIHFTSEDEQGEILRFLGLRNFSFVVPNGIDLSEFKEFPDRGQFKKKYPVLRDKQYVLFLSRISKKKGLDILVESLKSLADEYNDLYLVIAGPDNEGYGKEVKKWLNDYGLVDRVIFTGMLTGKEKLQAFVDADVFVLSSYSENFGMAVVEAMACGTPVVISNKVGIFNEIEQNKAGIIVDTNPESLYKGIKELLDDEHLRNRIAENGKRMVHEYYDIDKVADMMIRAYEGILKNAK